MSREHAMFRAFWPILDERTNWSQLCEAARADVPMLAAQASARLVGRGRFSIADSSEIAGSGRITKQVLLYEAPAVAVERRSYRRAS